MSAAYAPAFPVEGSYPFNDGGATVPPVCLKTHWDPTVMSKYILPTQFEAVPLPFRPAAQICRQYVTTGPVESLPASAPELPLRSNISPPDRYAAAIDRESQLRRLDRPLGTPEGAQFKPNMQGSMFSQQSYVPPRLMDSQSIAELEFPRALMVTGYDCRAAEDRKSTEKERVGIERGRMFNYSTKYDKYTA
jgi:hypothetical protein